MSNLEYLERRPRGNPGFMLLHAGLSAQDLTERPGRPTGMPPRQNHELDQMQARFRKHFKVRCERLADMYNRPRFRFLRVLGLDPPPPHCGLLVGQRRWSMLFIRWRELGFAMATALGYQDAGPPAAASNREPSGWPLPYPSLLWRPWHLGGPGQRNTSTHPLRPNPPDERQTHTPRCVIAQIR